MAEFSFMLGITLYTFFKNHFGPTLLLHYLQNIIRFNISMKFFFGYFLIFTGHLYFHEMLHMLHVT